MRPEHKTYATRFRSTSPDHHYLFNRYNQFADKWKAQAPPANDLVPRVCARANAQIPLLIYHNFSFNNQYIIIMAVSFVFRTFCSRERLAHRSEMERKCERAGKKSDRSGNNKSVDVHRRSTAAKKMCGASHGETVWRKRKAQQHNTRQNLQQSRAQSTTTEIVCYTISTYIDMCDKL